MPTLTTGPPAPHALRRRRLALQTSGRADVLVRVLTLLRRRGCRIAAVEFQEADRHRPERFEVVVNAPARVEPRLESWLAGLVDVVAVRDRSERMGSEQAR